VKTNMVSVRKKIAIHHRPGSFSDYWIEWCKTNNVPFKIVNAYDSNIIADLNDCDGFMWHSHHDSYADQLFARQLTLALDHMGKKVFPDVSTFWHFDDKIAQKYLFEVAGVQHVPIHIFYTKEKALEWLTLATFPLVFKLRGGAGSINVKLVKELRDAVRLVNRAFGSGFPVIDVYAIAKQARWEYIRDKKPRQLLRAIYYYLRAFSGLKPSSMQFRERQRGYIYFQDFIPQNTFDHRLIVIGNRCFCIQRGVREGDFRASGSGLLSYNQDLFPEKIIQTAFQIAAKFKTQSLALDFLYSESGDPLVVEMSYAFPRGKFAEDCPGYFDITLKWHNVKCIQPVLMIEDFMKSIVTKGQPEVNE